MEEGAPRDKVAQAYKSPVVTLPGRMAVTLMGRDGERKQCVVGKQRVCGKFLGKDSVDQT